MTYITDRTAILHFPKTAGIFVRRSLKLAKLTWVKRDQHGLTIDPNRFNILFVRRPDDWLRSYWCYQTKSNWRFYDASPPFILQACKADRFNKFVENYLEHMPGVISNLFEQYAGPPDNERVDYIGKVENVVEDLIEGLTLAKEEFEPIIIREAPAANVSSNSYKSIAQYSNEMRNEVLKAETKMLRRFYPKIKPPK
jgi:hypothetical protein